MSEPKYTVYATDFPHRGEVSRLRQLETLKKARTYAHNLIALGVTHRAMIRWFKRDGKLGRATIER